MNPSPSEQTLKTAVIGVGYLGNFHAEKYQQSPDAELVAVVDLNLDQAKKVGDRLGIPALDSYEPLLQQVDAVSIVVPTQRHYETARIFLQNGIHVLLEKPMTTTVEEAQGLINVASDKDLVLQIGHLERFNPAVLAMDGVLDSLRVWHSGRTQAQICADAGLSGC